MEQQFITFTVTKDLASYTVAYVNDAAFRIAITKAWLTAPDNAEEITVTLHHAQVVNVYAQLMMIPEGVGKSPNKMLRRILDPLIEEFPQVTQMLQELSEKNKNTYQQIIQTGKFEIEKIITLIGLN